MDRYTLNRRPRGRVVGTAVLLAAVTVVAALAACAAGSAAPSRRLLVLRQEPGAQSWRRVRQGPDRDWHERRRAALDEHRRPVRRGRLYRLRCRLVLGELEGPADKGKNYFFGGTTTAATIGEGEHRQPDDQAPGGRCRS